MAEHYEIRPDQRGLAMRIAQRALRVASGLSTARPGYVYIPNGDGTGTWIGGEVGSGGVAEWIGDTTPPGRPTGCSCSSAWGTVYAKWDGTLEGGVPADLAYVEVTAGDAVLGRLSEAGTVAADGFEDGQQLDVTFVAWDGAKARDGSPAPNASGPTVVQVTVSNERDAIDEAVQEASDKADALQQEMTEVKTTVSGVEQDVTELSTQVSGAVEKADQSLSVATEAKQTADAISDTAERAYEDAQSALTQASSAVQTATQLQQTVEEDYLSKGDAAGTYASKSDVTQTASDILSTVESEYQSKDGMGSYYTKTEVDQKNDAITSTVSEAVATADGAMEKATTVEQTVDGLEVTLESTTSTANSALSAAQSAQSAAADARKVATNYLSFSSEGLVVGDQTAGTLGGNTLVKSSGVAVRQGTNELATFGASSIELGKNSTSSQVFFCGRTGSISSDRGAAGLRITKQGIPSCFVSLQGSGQVDIQSFDQLEYGSLISLSQRSGLYGIASIESDGIELNWGSQGLRGRVMKKIWSGSAGQGATINVPDLPCYNLICVECSDKQKRLFGFREKSQGVWAFGFAWGNYDVLYIAGGEFNMSSSTSLSVVTKPWFIPFGSGGQQPWGYLGNITAIYGLL